MSSGAEGKTEKATPKKRRDERKKGNIFQSRDIVNVVSVLAIFFTMKLILPFIFSYLENMLLKYMGWIKYTDVMSESFSMDLLRDGVITLLLLAGPIMLIAMAVGIIASGVQTKFTFSKEHLKLKLSKLNPFAGIKRMFSIRSTVELIKSLLKVTVISYVLYSGIRGIITQFSMLLSVSVLSGVSFILNSIFDIVLKVTLVFAVIAFFDYLYQWWEYEKSIRMSKQDMKEEYKHTEGDPQIKGKIRERQRQMAMRRMMQNVPSADVIIKNPTHFAVALKYESGKNRAPVVVAKGQDFTALKILQIAEQYRIPTKEDKTLARALYHTVEIDKEIPSEFYAAMAEILAWVFTLKKQKGGTQRV